MSSRRLVSTPASAAGLMGILCVLAGVAGSARASSGLLGVSAKPAGASLTLVGAPVKPAGLPLASAASAPPVALHAALHPERLGESTTVSIGFQIEAEAGQLPSPLTEFDVRLPAGMGLAATTLGLATCSPKALLLDGGADCSAEARMGFGSASAKVSLGPQIVSESAHISILMGQSIGGHTTMLYYFEGKAPVIAPLVFPSEVLSLANSLTSEFDTEIPPIPTLPGAPDVAILSMRANIGPDNLTYHRHVDGRVVGYRPTGMSVPPTCPKGGFVFTAEFGFQDGAHTSATSTVACPRTARRARNGHRTSANTPGGARR